MTMESAISLPSQIDDIDDQIIDLLARRFVLSRTIGESKRALGAPPHDPERTFALTVRFMRRSIDRGISVQLARTLIGAIIDQVIAERMDPSIIDRA